MDEMRSTDVASYLRVSKQRVSQLGSEQGFPQPRHLFDGTRVWRADVVMRWAERSWWGSKPWRERPVRADALHEVARECGRQAPWQGSLRIACVFVGPLPREQLNERALVLPQF